MQDIAQACWEAIDDAYPGERAILVGCSIGSSMLIWMHNHRSPQTAALIMCGTGYNPKKEFIPPRIEAYKEHGMRFPSIGRDTCILFWSPISSQFLRLNPHFRSSG